MKILACFYFFATILDGLEHKFFVHALNEVDIVCISNKYVEV